MKHFAWQWLAISALLIATSAAKAETRPQYGGTLHVTMHASPLSLEPAAISESIGGRNLVSLLFDTLVTTDAGGRVQPSLAESWQISPGDPRVQIRLRRNVKFHDGNPLSPEIVAASLRKTNPAWTVTAAADLVIIDSNTSLPDFLQQLALPRNAIAKGDSGIGTGPFHVVNWHAGKKLTLATYEDYWGGRPFLDQIEIDMGISMRDQVNALESGRADLVEVAPEQIHGLPSQRYQVLRSSAMELVALKFAGDPTSAEQKSTREALRFSVERGSMHKVLLQSSGQPTASLLPTWMSGYGFVFSTDADLSRAQQFRDQVPGVPSLTLGFDSNDSMARLLAERIALNAKDAGLWVQLNPAANDLRLVRISLASSDPWVALENLVRQMGLPPIKSKSHSIEELYGAEQAALASGRVVPLFHLPVSYGSATSLRDWALKSDGSLDLANAWLKSPQP